MDQLIIAMAIATGHDPQAATIRTTIAPTNG